MAQLRELLVLGKANFLNEVTTSQLLKAFGGIALNNSTEESESLPYFLGIKSFTDGGNIVWSSPADTANTIRLNASGTWAINVSGSATYASNVRITATNPTTATTYNIPFVTGINEGINYPLRGNESLRYKTLEGTTTSEGYGRLYLGNNIATGTAGNKSGGILIYSSGTSYQLLLAHPSAANGSTAATSRTTYLRDYGSTAYLAATTTRNAVGSAALPVYVNTNGVITACTASSLFSAFSSSTNTLSITIAGLTKTANAVNSVSNTWAVGTSTAGPSLSTTVNGVTGTAVRIPVATNTTCGVTKVFKAEDCDGFTNDTYTLTCAAVKKLYNSYYAVCSTAGSTAKKAVSCTSFSLVTGARIAIKFSNTNTASNPQLNVNSTGDKDIYYEGAAIKPYQLRANKVYTFVYDGTRYNVIGDLGAPGWKSDASTAATVGWYRIATSRAGIGNCIGTFEIVGARSGAHTVAIINASTSYGKNSQIQATEVSSYSTAAITKARIVYHATEYTDNYAYLEVYNPNAAALPITVTCIGGYGWSPISPSTAGSIPDGYTNKEITLSNNPLDARYVNVTGDTMTGALNINGANLFIQSTNPYIGFKNSTGTLKGYVQYIESSDTYAFGAGSVASLWVTATGSISIPASQSFTPRTTKTGSLGTSSNVWSVGYFNNLHIYGSTSATVSADSTNPKITFSENGTQPVHLIYSDYDSYRSPAGLKIIGGASATPAWLEIEGSVYSGGDYTSTVAGARFVANNTSRTVWFGSSVNGDYQGIYDATAGYYLIRNTDSTHAANGVTLGAATIVEGQLTVNGNIIAQDDSTTNRSVKANNSNGSVGVYTSTNRGLYDFTRDCWIIYSQKSDNTTRIQKDLYCDGHVYLAASKCIYMNYNSTNYNVLVNYNNGNTGMNAAGSGLYLGYSNTNGVYFGTSGGWATINSAGITTSGKLTLSGTTATTSQIYFGRGDASYFMSAAGGYFCFIPNGQGTGIANADLIINNNQVYPGTTNVTSLGLSSKMWSHVYATNINATYLAASTVQRMPIYWRHSSSRYGEIVVQNNAGTTVAGIVSDVGNATNITQHRWRFRSYSANSTNDTATTGFYEDYYLPASTDGLTASTSYYILTTKASTQTYQVGRLIATETQDAAHNAANGVALITGSPTGTHLEFDGNEIFAKTSGTAAGTLYLQSGSGTTEICSYATFTNNVAGGFNFAGRIDVGCLLLTNTSWTGYGTADPSGNLTAVKGRVYFKII